MVQWFSPSGLVLCKLVTLSCKLWIFSPPAPGPAMVCWISSLLTPDVQLLQSSSGFSSSPQTSHPTMATCFLVASLGIPAGKQSLQAGPFREWSVPPRAQASARCMMRAFPNRHWITQCAAACCFPAIAKSQFGQRQNKAALDLRNNRLQP